VERNATLSVMVHPTVSTIVACATGHVQAGISIVRVSGPLASTIAHQLTHRVVTKPNHAVYRAIFDKDGDEIDRGVVVFFKSPASFTGEDLLEVHTHGSPFIVQQVIATCLTHGAELAKPGEFSERAFLNGKIDLVQAEGIADLIASQTKAQATAANASVQGAFSKAVARLQASLTAIRTDIEAAIDFSDQAVSTNHERVIQSALAQLAVQGEALLDQVKRAILTQAGLRVVMLGEPNVGKSSLLNQLTQQDFAIVTDIPGTTRDTLRARIVHAGQSIEVIDTAGLRDSHDPIESIGIQKAIQAVQSADVIWLMVDASTASETHVTQQRKHIPREKQEALLIVANKRDLVEQLPSAVDTAVSALNGDNIEQLLEMTLEKVGHTTEKSPFSARERHQIALEAFLGHVRHAGQAPGAMAELIAEDLRLAQRCLSEITGEFHSEDLLDAIFRTFCLGK
jgi:tRNA modification GTPase